MPTLKCFRIMKAEEATNSPPETLIITSCYFKKIEWFFFPKFWIVSCWRCLCYKQNKDWNWAAFMQTCGNRTTEKKCLNLSFLNLARRLSEKFLNFQPQKKKIKFVFLWGRLNLENNNILSIFGDELIRHWISLKYGESWCNVTLWMVTCMARVSLFIFVWGKNGQTSQKQI